MNAPPDDPSEKEATDEAPTPSAEDWSTRYKYLLADFENFRRRVDRDREAITRQARAGMLRELLPIFEAFRAAQGALNHLPRDDPVRTGLELLDREWMTFFKHEGVEPVAENGRPFRAAEAEAIGETSPDPQHPEGTVVEIVQQGYRFFGGLLRPAKVVIARAPPAPAQKEPVSSEDIGE